jgi:hypothetical protein
VLALPRAYAPEIGCLRDGFKIFLEKHGSRLDRHTALRFLTGLGAQLWRERMASAALEETAAEINGDGSNGERPEDSVGGKLWTPESVSAAVEKTILHCAHLIRRARWFCLLSESALTWSSAEQPDKYKTWIILENGRIVERRNVKTAVKTPAPSGFAKSFRTRQSNLDLVAYDRLRVLTTELRRLVAEDRKIEIRFSPGASLDSQGLSKALRWV